MKCTIPEISWHNREPVLSIDIHPQTDIFFRLATGGADCHVLIWQLNVCDNGAVKIEALSDLRRHQRAVNCVKWSPQGQYLATADDDANIIIWQLKTDNIPLLEGETNDKETWSVVKVMRGHKEDIYDLSWSPNGEKLLSGSIDNTAILWDFAKGSNDIILTDHKGFVQGVSWDPKSQYFATISTDRTCRIFKSTGKQIKARIIKGLLPVPTDHHLHNKEVKYFHDDTFKSFFRRLDFSPDGSLIGIPSGRVEVDDCSKILCGTYIFAIEQWSAPVAIFPCGKQCSTVVRFCPILFELHKDGPDPVISLPFRMILAVGTDHDVILYDTQQLAPFAYFRDIHYTRLTDLSWSKDGTLLIASSTDGFCALITFGQAELGVQYIKEESDAEESTMDVSGCEEFDKEDIQESVKPKKPNLLEKWTIKTPKRNRTSDSSQAKNLNKEDDDSKNNVKRIKPMPVNSNEEPKIVQKMVTHACQEKNNQKMEIKRLKPVTVIQSPKPSEITEAKETPKGGTLLNFLKSTPKEKKKAKSKIQNSTPISPVLIDLSLEGNNARDSWKCEKDVDKITENKVIEIEDTTDDFSLHLDTVSRPCRHKGENTEEADSVQTYGETLRKSKDSRHDTKVFDKETKDFETNRQESECKDISKITVQTEDTINEKDINKEAASMKIENSLIEDLKQEDCPKKLSLVKPTRRIPLITLSSPKHKKK